MSFLGQTLVLYLLPGVGVAGAVYLSGRLRDPLERWLAVLLALPFWPFYLPILLARGGPDAGEPPQPPAPCDDMAAAITQVDAELEAALASLDGWASDVLAREKDRLHELRSAWTAQAERIREMDRLLALPEYATADLPLPCDGSGVGDRLHHSRQARLQNIERLRQVRRRAYDDLMGTLAWVRELVSMIHLAKFTGAPAARAEELVAQIAAAVEGLSEITWREETV
jgi:hypothetical protein